MCQLILTISKCGVYHKLAAAKAIGVFDLVKKGRDPFLLGEVSVYRDFTDVNQFIGCRLWTALRQLVHKGSPFFEVGFKIT